MRGQRQNVGTEVGLGKNPTGAPFAEPRNKGTFQMTGTALTMPSSPTQQSPSANPKEGTRQDKQASHVPAPKTPVKMISDLDPSMLPFSHRAVKQSDTA